MSENQVRRIPVINDWRSGMMGVAKAHDDGVVAFFQTDFTEDLKKITAPVLVMHGDAARGGRASRFLCR